MRRLMTSTLLVLSGLLALPVASQAQHRGPGWHGDIRRFQHHDYNVWRGGGWRHGYYGGRMGWWWVTGGMYYYYPQPVYPYPDPYTPPVVVMQPQISAPVVVAEPAPAQPPVQSAPAAPQVWYYCEPSQTYYPYVATCTAPWKMVPATPNPQGTTQ